MGNDIPKPFFRRRTVAEERELKLRRVGEKRHILDILLFDINPEREAVEAAFQAIPGNCFVHGIDNEHDAAVYWRKYGYYLELPQPRTTEVAWNWPNIPLISRDEALIKEREACRRPWESHALGFSYWGISSKEMLLRIFPADSIVQGRSILMYANSINEPLITDIMAGKRTDTLGAEVHARVPSRRVGYPDYEVVVRHVPIYDRIGKKIAAWNLTTEFIGNAPLSVLKNIRMKPERENAIYWDEHSIAAYFAFIEQQLERDNYVTIQMNPVAIPSNLDMKLEARINNNLLFHDFCSPKHARLRHPYEAEKAWLHMQLALSSRYNRDFRQSMYWDPARDGRLSELPRE